MLLNNLLSYLISILFFAPLIGAAPVDEDGHYWETDINPDCGQIDKGAKHQQIGAMQWGIPDANGHLPYSYNTKVCLTTSPGLDCIRLSSAEDHKVNRFYLGTGFSISVFSDDNCQNDRVAVKGQTGSLFGEYKIHSYKTWKVSAVLDRAH